MNLPEPVAERLDRRDELVNKLGHVLRADQLIARPEDLAAYECDAVSAYRQRPWAVALPEETGDSCGN